MTENEGQGRKRFTVVQGGIGNYPCTWCGKTFQRRYIASDGIMSLEEHWTADPRCKTLARVSNQTQSKYGMADTVQDVPGERTLTRVRMADCAHPKDMRQMLFASDGRGGWTDEAVGWRCGWCYIEVAIDNTTFD